MGQEEMTRKLILMVVISLALSIVNIGIRMENDVYSSPTQSLLFDISSSLKNNTGISNFNLGLTQIKEDKSAPSTGADVVVGVDATKASSTIMGLKSRMSLQSVSMPEALVDPTLYVIALTTEIFFILMAGVTGITVFRFLYARVG